VQTAPQKRKWFGRRGEPEDRALTRDSARPLLLGAEGVPPTLDARKAMTLAASKLPIKTKFATRFGMETVS